MSSPQAAPQLDDRMRASLNLFGHTQADWYKIKQHQRGTPHAYRDIAWMDTMYRQDESTRLFGHPNASAAEILAYYESEASR